MDKSVLKGFGFGLTSGIITTLGLIIGLHSGTHSTKVIIEGVVVIAVADALSDALGIHISEESGSNNTKKIWEATAFTFLSKLVFAGSFLIPLLLFSLQTAVILSMVWGLSLISVFSYYIAVHQHERPFIVVLEHLFISILVIILTHSIGAFVALLL